MEIQHWCKWHFKDGEKLTTLVNVLSQTQVNLSCVIASGNICG